jgi:polysaccharide pyruvyl transferase WcaK-like protein
LYVRDELSWRTLSDLLPGRSVEAIGDTLLSLEPAEESPAPLKELGGRYIAVNLTPRWDDDPSWRPWICESIMKTARRLDASVAFVPCTQNYDRDQDEQEAVASRMRDAGFDRPIVCLGAGYTPREISAAFGGAILTIGMRLHACILSYARRVPWVALAYHPKLSGFAVTVEQPERVLPRILPASQSSHMYGYTLSDLKLVDCDLERAAVEGRRRSPRRRTQHRG